MRLCVNRVLCVNRPVETGYRVAAAPQKTSSIIALVDAVRTTESQESLRPGEMKIEENRGSADTF